MLVKTPARAETRESSRSTRLAIFHQEPFTGSPGWSGLGATLMAQETREKRSREAARR
jgi:hypothetical protein